MQKSHIKGYSQRGENKVVKKGKIYAKEAFIKENFPGKGLNEGKIYATKAIHDWKVDAKKPLCREIVCEKG